MSLSTRLAGRLAGLAALVLALGPLAGCDGVDATGGASGPVVQFGASSASVIEGNIAPDSVRTTTVGTRVTLPVRLTGADGTPVTVEVLLASNGAVTTARFGARNADGTFPVGVDFVDFGAAADGVQKATVTFSGQADETQNVTFTVVRDGTPEPSESVVFALQRPTGATIGPVREVAVNIGVPVINVVRQTPVTPQGGTPVIVTVQGIVTRALGRQVYLQDATGAIILFGPEGSPIANAVLSGAIAIGDEVQAQGRLIEFNSGPSGAPVAGAGILEIDNILAGGFIVLSRANAVLAPQLLTLAQATAGDPDPDTYENEIVRIENLTINPAGDVVFAAGRNYTVSQTVDGVTTTAVFRSNSAIDTNVDGTPIPTGPFTYVGPLAQFRGTNQLQPVLVTDIVLPTP